MNRILFESDEIADGVVRFDDFRAEHVLKVLHGEVGQTLKTGEIDGLVGTAEILAIDGGAVTARVEHAALSPRPWVDVVLAPPRPRVLKRLLPQFAALGVGRIILVGAKKVEKDFWGATLLKREIYRPLLIEGLMQAGTSVLPVIESWKSFNRFVREGLSGCAHRRRLVAHPYGGRQAREFAAAAESAAESAVEAERGRLLLAIGPEGGWTDEEVVALEAAGFQRCSLGPRILRTDTAAIALLAQLMD